MNNNTISINNTEIFKQLSVESVDSLGQPSIEITKGYGQGLTQPSIDEDVSMRGLLKLKQNSKMISLAKSKEYAKLAN